MNSRLSRIFRFAIVGGVNTAVDVTIFSLLSIAFDFNVFAANIASTSAALAISYMLHSRFTFASDMDARTFIMFILITLSGLWLLQPLIIILLTPLFGAILPYQSFSVVLAKLTSIGATLVWNYLGYSRLVFISDSEQEARFQRHL